MIKAILFDLDDTLYEEKQFVAGGFKTVAEYLSIKYRVDYDKVFKILKDAFEKGLRRKNFDVLLKKLAIEKEPCLLYTSPSPRDLSTSRMPSSA